MLGDRAWGWKFIGAFALVVAACAWSHRRSDGINPAYWYCRFQPERHDGTVLWTPIVEVKSVNPGGFVVDSPLFPGVAVAGALPEGFGAGSVIGIAARFRRDGSLELLRLRERRFLGNPRRILDAASAAALLVVVLFFFRAFRLRWDRLSLKRNG